MANEVDPGTALANILAAHGPLSEEEAERHLLDAGVDVDFEELLDDAGDAVGMLTDGRWVWLPPLLDGRTLTHRLSATERAYDVLTTGPDLEPLLATDDGLFTDGSPARVVVPGFDEGLLAERGFATEADDINGVLLLPPGTLEALDISAGELVGLRLVGGRLAVERVDALDDAPLGPRLAALLEDVPLDLDPAIWTLCAEDPTLLTTPLLPLDEIIEHQGLVLRVDQIAPAEFDFDSWTFDRGCDFLARRHDLDDADAVALYTLVQVCDTMQAMLAANDPETGVAESAAGVGGALADPDLADIFVDEVLDTYRISPAALGMFAETLEPQVPRPARVAYRWLRATALERIGDVESAERELLAAESLDTDWAPALFDLGRFAADRGDTERALSLLRRGGADPEGPLVELLERHRAQPRTDVGRNDACWCGSGRKYKKCHLGREQLSLTQRADWLYAKAAQHMLRNGWGELLNELGDERARYAVERDEILDALADPIVMDAALFEGGAFEEFLEVRGSLLPDDERLLAQQWLLVERSVFEVEHVDRGRGFTARDVRSGDTHSVRDVLASRQLAAGELICARVVPVEDTMQIFGGLTPVALRERDALIALLDDEPDPVELVAFLSRRYAPATLINTERDPMVFCETTIRVGDQAAIAEALDDAYDRVDGDDALRWHEYVVTDGMRRVRAVLVLDGDTLTVETNSEERMDRVLAVLTRLDPGMTVLDDTRRPARDAREAAALTAQLPAGTGLLSPDDPEVAAALEEFVREYEAKWLDTPIPALNGYTPRQAADDPTRREDLIALLNSFPAGDAARGGMDADRLRAALGL